MDQVNTYEAKKNLSSLLKRVQKGETVIIANHNKPIAELRPIMKEKKIQRLPGLAKGEITLSDNFNDPLPDEVLDLFHTSALFPK